jgi:hypothetical protein
MDAFAYVRVVRNHYYYPQNPTDGVVIYEGVGVSFYDEAALNQYDRQYYTIFAYNIDGVPSSGAVAAAARDQVVTEAPAVPGVEVPTTVATSAEAFRLTFADVTVVQNDELIAASAETMVLKADTPFMIRVPVAMVPGAAKTVIVTWQHPFDSMKTTSYLLKRNAEGTYYEAIAAPIADTGIYPLHVAVFDAATNMLGSVSGTFEIFRSDVAPEASGQSIAYIATTYIIVGGIIGLCTVLGLWWIFVTLLRLLFRKK